MATTDQNRLLRMVANPKQHAQHGKKCKTKGDQLALADSLVLGQGANR